MGMLVSGTGPEWRARIQEAVGVLSNCYDEELLKTCMSGPTFALLQACSPERFRRPFRELTDREVKQLAHALGGFILNFHREQGAREARKKAD